MAKISIRNITAENVEDIMATAGYGGITYWAEEPLTEDFAGAKPGEHTIRDGEARKVYHPSPAKIRQAVVEIAKGKHVNDRMRDYIRRAFEDWNAEDGIDCSEIDADVADCIVQVACFGKIVYG